MFHVPENFRVKRHPTLASDSSYGNNGAFEVSLSNTTTAWVIASDGEGWEHVSIHISDTKIHSHAMERTPSWSEMCKIKDLFWDDSDCVIQYHPPKSEYVNNHKYTLHLWRPLGVEIPMPNSLLVG